MRLIDADAFRKHCQNIVIEEFDNPALISWPFAYDNVIDEINEQPIVDAVPVVRCKDCKHCDKHPYTPLCYFWSEAGIRVSENDYCSHGEMREK